MTEMTEKMKNIVAAVIVAGSIFGVVAMAGAVIDEGIEELPPCATEDSDNCYWDASVQGNGEGRSFDVRDGVVTYWDETQR
ncbi:membrane protein [Microbacterium phage Huwbert]|nr:membrane protein [Microbacterium phage Huwbert]WNO27862.1 membrane protein [Microbacterium phage Huwbert]